MKNFKKVLALVLALATLLSFATIAGAKVDTTAIYADADDVKYVEAVDVLTAIGVLNGKGASYKPNDTLKRSEAAKIIAMFDNGDTDISSLYNPANTFVDVAKDYWAISYIAYCAKQGIISGVGNNKYAPESKLTGIQFLKMVLVTLGYDAKEEGLVGTSWKVNVLKLARAAGLTDVLGKKYDYDKELTRDAAAQIMLNALNAKTVSYGQEFKTSGKKNILTAAGAIENASYLYESWDLKREDDKMDAFGRPCHIWKLGKKETIGTYKDAPLASYTVAVAGCDIINDCDFDEEGVKLTSYTDGVKGSNKGTLTIKNTTKEDIGGQGVLTEVYEDRIVFINTYLAKVTKVVSQKEDAKGHVTRKAETTMKVWDTLPTTRFDKKAATEGYKFESESFAKDDMVIVTIADGVVKTVKVAESKIAEFSKIKKVDGEFAQIALDGEYVDIAAKYVFDGIATGDLGKDMVAYYDAYGNLVGMEVYYAPLNYAVIDAIWVETVKGKATIKADLWTVGGDELEDVSVDSIKLTSGTEIKAKDVVDAYTLEASGAPSTGTYNWLLFAQSKYAKNNVYDRLMSYTSDDNGVYTLTMKWDSSTPYGEIAGNNTTGATGPLEKATFSNGSSYVKVGTDIKIQMTDETVVLVQNTDTSAPYATYTSYTGYDNVPSMTGKVWYHLDSETKKADVIYVYGVSVTGTETVIFYKGDVRSTGAQKNGKFPLEFDAYALDKDTGSLTKQTYIYKATNKTALADADKGFYTVYVNDKNELTFKGVDAGNDVVAGKALNDATFAQTGFATNPVGAVLQVGALVIDGGTKDITAYSLSKIEALDYDKVEAGDLLYVYKNKDNGKFTVVDAVDVATVVFVNSSDKVLKGTATDETIGHDWEAMTINSIEEGYLKTGFTVELYDKYTYNAASGTATFSNETGTTALSLSNAEAIVDQPGKKVRNYVKVTVNVDPAYTTLGLNLGDLLGGWGEVTTAPATTPTEGVITLKVGTVVKASQIAADVAGKVAANDSNATVAVYSANGVMADADATLIANKTAGDNYSTWYLMLTAKNGVSVKVTFILP